MTIDHSFSIQNTFPLREYQQCHHTAQAWLVYICDQIVKAEFGAIAMTHEKREVVWLGCQKESGFQPARDELREIKPKSLCIPTALLMIHNGQPPHVII